MSAQVSNTETLLDALRPEIVGGTCAHSKPPLAVVGPESLATGKTVRLNWGDSAEV